MGYGVGALQNSRTPLPPVRPRRTPAGTAWSPGCAAREGGATQGELGPPLSRAARSSAQTEAGFTISGDFRTVGKDGYLSGDFLSNFGYSRVNINRKNAKFNDSRSIRMPHSASTFGNGIAVSGQSTRAAEQRPARPPQGGPNPVIEAGGQRVPPRPPLPQSSAAIAGALRPGSCGSNRRQ